MADAATLDPEASPAEGTTQLADAHIHCVPEDAIAAGTAAGVRRMGLCATSEADWARVAALAAAFPDTIIPSYGLHPWWAGEVEPGAQLDGVVARLEALLLEQPGAAVGEIGLDRCGKGLQSAPWERQVAAFSAQLALAAKLRRAISVHCVQAHTQLLELLAAHVEAWHGGGSEQRAPAVAGPGGSGAAEPGAGRAAPAGTASASAVRRYEGISGLLLHSWAGSAGVATRLINLFPRVPVVFSFHGEA
jgi:Tat protein secretion system quality control protein TatD with DNase activity